MTSPTVSVPKENPKPGSLDYETWIFCAFEGCEAHHRTDHWPTKRAQAEGWFIQRNGDHWCPAHVPSWVTEWRARRAR
jgi:hypothetical protein